MENQDITKEVLFAHFEGAVSTRQRQLIDEWARKPENEERFYQYLMEWELAQTHQAVDTERGIARFRTQIQEAPAITEDIALPIRRYWPRYAVACAVLVMTIGGIIFRDQIRYTHLTTGPDELRSWTLPDGSRVSLHASSELRFPRWGFGPDSREVVLKGEAAFVVTHQPNDQRFVVKAGEGVDVTVLGTEFSVYSRPGKTQVVLSKGKVSLQRREEVLLMKPGDRIIVEHGTLSRNRFDNAAEYSSRRESRFVFNRTSLAEIGQLLATNYGLHVAFSQPALESLTVSGSFMAADAHDLIRSVSQILGIGYTLKDKRVVFLPEPAER
nr:FecR domain-containing protein [uncultured Dyadobacter sp.]